MKVSTNDYERRCANMVVMVYQHCTGAREKIKERQIEPRLCGKAYRENQLQEYLHSVYEIENASG